MEGQKIVSRYLYYMPKLDGPETMEFQQSQERIHCISLCWDMLPLSLCLWGFYVKGCWVFPKAFSTSFEWPCVLCPCIQLSDVLHLLPCIYWTVSSSLEWMQSGHDEWYFSVFLNEVYKYFYWKCLCLCSTWSLACHSLYWFWHWCSAGF